MEAIFGIATILISIGLVFSIKAILLRIKKENEKASWNFFGASTILMVAELMIKNAESKHGSAFFWILLFFSVRYLAEALFHRTKRINKMKVSR